MVSLLTILLIQRAATLTDTRVAVANASPTTQAFNPYDIFPLPNSPDFEQPNPQLPRWARSDLDNPLNYDYASSTSTTTRPIDIPVRRSRNRHSSDMTSYFPSNPTTSYNDRNYTDALIGEEELQFDLELGDNSSSLSRSSSRSPKQTRGFRTTVGHPSPIMSSGLPGSYDPHAAYRTQGRLPSSSRRHQTSTLPPLSPMYDALPADAGPSNTKKGTRNRRSSVSGPPSLPAVLYPTVRSTSSTVPINYMNRAAMTSGFSPSPTIKPRNGPKPEYFAPVPTAPPRLNKNSLASTARRRASFTIGTHDSDSDSDLSGSSLSSYGSTPRASSASSASTFRFV